MGAPHPGRSLLMAAVVARVRGGEALRSACGRDGVPPVSTVRYWMKVNAPFRAELAAALQVGRHRRELAWDDDKAAAFLSRVRAGERIDDVVGQPGMPRRRMLTYWRSTMPGFAEAMGALRLRRDAAFAQLARDRWRAWDPAVGDAVIVALFKGTPIGRLHAAHPHLPSDRVLTRWRREQPAFDTAVRAVLKGYGRRRGRWDVGRRCTPELTQWVCDQILVGGSFNSIAAMPGAPRRRTLSAWVRTRPAFAAAVAQACVDREDWFNDQIDEIEAEMTPGMTVKELAAIRARAAPVRGRLGRLRKQRPGRRRGERGEASGSPGGG